MSELYRDFIDGKADEIINSLGGTITPAPANAELYRDFLDRKFDDVVNAVNNFPKIKSFTYEGNNQFSRTITLPADLKLILLISSDMYTTSQDNFDHFQTTGALLSYNDEVMITAFNVNQAGYGGSTFHYSINNGEITFYSVVNRHWGLNMINHTYTVYYI